MSIIPFQPSNVGPFRFQPTLDGDQYNAEVRWNMSGERYYVNLFSLDGTRILTLPVIGSTDGITIESIAWAHGLVKVTTTAKHGYLAGATVDLTISRCSPVAYNGRVKALITGLDKFQYPLSSDPGAAHQFGVSSYDIDIVAGYFTTSRLVFRESSQVFEITP